MTYREFKNKYLGKGINFDGKYGNQCVDAYRQYAKELGFPQSPPVTGAKDIWDSYLPEYWERIDNTPDGVPQEGDVIIWSKDIGAYGHVGIFDRGTTTSFYSIDQNWPEDGGTGVLKEVKHTYKAVLGWLRPKLPVNEEMTEEEKRILQFLKEQGAGEGKVREAFGALVDIEKLKEQYESLKVLSDSLTKSVQDLTDKLTAEQELVSRCQSELSTANKLIEKLEGKISEVEGQNTALAKDRNKYKKWYEEALKKTIDKYTDKELLSELVNRFKDTWLKKSK